MLRERTLHKGIIQGEEGGSERERVGVGVEIEDSPIAIIMLCHVNKLK